MYPQKGNIRMSNNAILIPLSQARKAALKAGNTAEAAALWVQIQKIQQGKEGWDGRSGEGFMGLHCMPKKGKEKGVGREAPFACPQCDQKGRLTPRGEMIQTDRTSGYCFVCKEVTIQVAADDAERYSEYLSDCLQEDLNHEVLQERLVRNVKEETKREPGLKKKEVISRLRSWNLPLWSDQEDSQMESVRLSFGKYNLVLWTYEGWTKVLVYLFKGLESWPTHSDLNEIHKNRYLPKVKPWMEAKNVTLE